MIGIYFGKVSMDKLNELLDHGPKYNQLCVGYHRDSLDNEIWVAWDNSQHLGPGHLRVQDFKSEKEAWACMKDILMKYIESKHSEPFETKTTED